MDCLLEMTMGCLSASSSVKTSVDLKERMMDCSSALSLVEKSVDAMANKME